MAFTFRCPPWAPGRERGRRTSPHGGECTVALGGINKEPCLRLELLAANGKLDSRVLLHVPHPLALHVRGPDEHLVAVHNEPDFDLVGLSGLPPIVRQDQGLFACEPLQPGRDANSYRSEGCSSLGRFIGLLAQWQRRSSEAG
jgi:hypothetical protein